MFDAATYFSHRGKSTPYTVLRIPHGDRGDEGDHAGSERFWRKREVGLMISGMNQHPPHASSLFRGRHFDRSVITLCVRWHITYKLNYRDLVGRMAERGVDVSHTVCGLGLQGAALLTAPLFRR